MVFCRPFQALDRFTVELAAEERDIALRGELDGDVEGFLKAFYRVIWSMSSKKSGSMVKLGAPLVMACRLMAAG